MNCVQLNPRVSKNAKLLVAEFIEKPTSMRFKHMILSPRNGLTLVDYLCPIAHYNIEMKCTLHNCPRNPRLVYDFHGDEILVQRMYPCQHKGTPHKFLSASQTVLGSLPLVYCQNCFPIRMLYRTACNKELLDLVEK